MRRLKRIEHISMDGVIRHMADGRKFPCSDWTAPYRTPVGRGAVLVAHEESFDRLLGGRADDTWARCWPQAPGNPMADRLNGATR